MHVLSMSETKSKGYEALMPARSVESKPEQFGKLLNEQQQPRPQRAEAPQQAETRPQAESLPQTTAPQQSKPAEGNAVREKAEVDTSLAVPAQVGTEQNSVQLGPQEELVVLEVSQQQGAQPPQATRQLLALLQIIAAAAAPPATEQFDSSKPQLTQLVEQFDNAELSAEQLLSGIDLPALVEPSQELSTSSAGKEQLAAGNDLTALLQQLQEFPASSAGKEQLAAGIDLPVLVEQLQELFASPAGQEQLAQLVIQLDAQLNGDLALEPAVVQTDAELLAQAELIVAGILDSDPQRTATPLVENLAQVRQILQKAIALLNGKNPTAELQTVATDPETEAEMVASQPLAAPAESQIEPRFASLLTPRPENHHNPMSLRERVQQHNVAPVATANPTQAGEQLPAEAATKTEPAGVASSELFSAATKLPGENLQQLPVQGGQQQPPVMNLRSMPINTTTVQLPSGQQVAESQIFDQVVTRMSGSFNGESGKMVLRLHPAELGSLKLELVIEGDKVRANLVAQSQQVQEVLERNLPQLRSALAEQGLKIDQFRVDVEQHQQQSQFDNLAQQQQQRGRSQRQSVWPQQAPVEEQLMPLAHLLQNGGAGISLRV